VNATEYVRQCHAETEKLLRALLHASAKRDRERIAAELAATLAALMVAEQEVLYPECARGLNDDEFVRPYYEQHGVIAFQLQRLMDLAGDETAFAARALVLDDLVRRFIHEEERQLLRKAASALVLRLDDIGDALETRFQQVLDEDPHAALEEAVGDGRDLDRWVSMPSPFVMRGKHQKAIPSSGHTPRALGGAVRRMAGKTLREKPVSTGMRRREKSAGVQARKKSHRARPHGSR
jgi:hypothetical protein